MNKQVWEPDAVVQIVRGIYNLGVMDVGKYGYILSTDNPAAIRQALAALRVCGFLLCGGHRPHKHGIGYYEQLYVSMNMPAFRLRYYQGSGPQPEMTSLRLRMADEEREIPDIWQRFKSELYYPYSLKPSLWPTRQVRKLTFRRRWQVPNFSNL